MPRKSVLRKSGDHRPVTAPSERYWHDFLRTLNLVGLVPSAELETPRREEHEGIEQGMQTWAYRVAERLTPLDGLSEEGRGKALKVREQFRKEILDVLLGREDYNAWFDRTRTKLGLHMITFIKMLYECLEGLRGEGAKSLRAEYESTLKRLQQA